MKIVIETLPHKDQRYPSCGDWFLDHEGTLQIRVSELGDVKSETIVAIHEIIEALLCQEASISDMVVTRFDLQFEKEREVGEHTVDAEPGDDERAPYYREHQAATLAERAAAAALDRDWSAYEQRIHDLD